MTGAVESELERREDIPSTWVWARVSDFATSMKNGIYKARDAYGVSGTACLRMYNIEQGSIVWRDIKRMRLSRAELADYGLCAGDLLVNRVNSRELVGKTAVIPEGLEFCVFESKNIRLRVDGSAIDGRYLNYRLLVDGSRFFNLNAQQTVGMASINQEQLGAFPIPLASLPEQHRIVAEIEKQFTRLDAAVAALKRTRANLKRYRAAVLKAACEGRLVPTEAELARAEGRDYESGEQLLARILNERRARWEAKQQLKYARSGKLPPLNWRSTYEEPAAPDMSELPDLPEGWSRAAVRQIAWVQGGIQKQPKRMPVANAFPFLRVANVLRGRLDLSDIHRIELFGDELQKLKLQHGDLLVIEGNGSPTEIGRMAIWDGSVENCVHQNHIIRVRIIQEIDPRYIEYFWNSPTGADSVAGVASSTSGLYTLSVAKVSDILLPIPPFAEQQRIVTEVERRLSVLEKLEESVAAGLQRAERLRQAILKQAFAGRLVPQDPNDDPASVLLERIRAEREAGGVEAGGKQRRRKKATEAEQLVLLNELIPNDLAD